jgi:hypothetical protein
MVCGCGAVASGGVAVQAVGRGVLGGRMAMMCQSSSATAGRFSFLIFHVCSSLA